MVKPNFLFLAAVAEAFTGLALIVVPSLVADLLLGEPLTGPALSVGRVAGIALLSLSIACWTESPRAGMLVYSTSVMAFLAYVGLTMASPGALLWPAVIAHLLMSILIAREVWIGDDNARQGQL